MVTWGANTVHNIGGTGGIGAAATVGTTAAASAPSSYLSTPTTVGTAGLFGSTTTTPGTAATTTTPVSFGGGFSFASSTTNPATTPATGSTTTTTNTAAGGGGLFGGTTGSGNGLFGNNTAAPPATGGLFGSSTTNTPVGAPTTTGGLFGSTSFFGGAGTPASSAPPSGGLFGNNSAGNTSSLFGNSGGGGSIFGSITNPSGSIFGSPAPTMQQQQQPQPPQIPAHAAIQAHMNAYARNEEARVLQRMQTIHQTYTGTVMATNDKSHCFSIPLYNPITEQQRQLQDAVSTIVMTTNNQGFMVSSALVAPVRPPQISDDDWKLACIRNPDANHFMPTAVVGANSLLARAILHQEQCNTIQKHMNTIQEALDHIQQRHNEITRLLDMAHEQHQKQCTRLLKIMKAVEVGRCFNIPLQSAELDAYQRIRHLKYSIIEEQIVPEVLNLTDPERQKATNGEKSNNSTTALATTNNSSRSSITIPIEKQKLWMSILKEHRHQIGLATQSLQKEQQDLQLLHDHVIGSTSSSKSSTSALALFK